MATGTVAQLNFEVILNTKDFDDKIKAVENRAKQFNTSLSQSIDIQKSVEKVMNASAKASAKAASERAKEAQSFGKYVEQLRKMEEQGKRMAEQMPKAFNWTHPINQTYLELNRVMEVLQKIQERQASGARIQYSADYLNKITAQGEGALRAINALEVAQKRLTAKDNGFQEHIRSLTNTNMTLLQMREHYAALEKDTARAAKETEKMYGSQAKATKEVQKQVPIGRTVEGLSAERAAIEKRIAENLANENKELSKLKTAEGTRASESKKVQDSQAKVNKLIEEATKKQERHRKEVEKTNNSLVSARSILSTISQLTGVYFGAMGIRRFLSSMIEITGQFEVQKMALRNMLQDVAAADRIFRQLYEFSSDSTYRFSELAKYAKQLSAFNIGKDNLLETTKMLGDVASGVGVSMDRLINAYGHVKSSGFLRGIQLRSFSQNGVPVLEELSKILTEVEGQAVSLGDVFDKMMKREIPFEMVEEAFKRMTSEGGKFYQMQEVLAKTLAGQINILKGKWENALYAIGQANDGMLKGGVKALRFMVEHLQEIGNALKPVIAGFGAYGLALAAASMGTWIKGAARAVEYFVLIARRTNLATAAVRTFGSASKAAAVGLGALSAAIVVVVSLTRAIGGANRELSDFRKELDEIHESARNNAFSEEITRIETLKKVLNGTNNEYAARKAALDELKTIVPGYHAQLTEEGRLINNNTIALERHIETLKREARVKGAQDEIAALENKKREIEGKIRKQQGIIEENAPVINPQTMAIAGGELLFFSSKAGWATRRIETYNEELEELKRQQDSVTSELAEIYADIGANVENYNVKDIVEAIKKYDADIKALRDKAKKGSISAAEKDLLDEYIKERGEQAKLYEDILGIKYDKDNKPTTTSEKTPKLTPTQKAWVAMMEETEDWLEKDFNKRLEENTKELEKGIKTREKAQEDYEKLFREWSGKDFGKHGVGAEFDISSDIAEYNNKNDAAQRKYEKALALVQIAHKGNAAAIKKERDELKKLLDAEKEMNKAEFIDAVSGRANAVFKEAMQGFDLTDWNDKTLAQILEIRKAIKNVKIPPAIAKDLEKHTEAAEALLDAFNKLKQDTLDNTVSPEMFKKVTKEAKRLAGYLGTAATKMRDFADATGNTKLSEAAEIVGALAQNMQAAADGAETWGGWWGAIIGGVSDLFNQITTGITNAAKASKELGDAIRDMKADAFLLSQTSLFSNDGIFGTNQARNIQGAVDAMRTLREHMQALGDPEIRRNLSFWEKMSLAWRTVYNRNHIGQEELPFQGKLTDVMARYGLNVYDQYDNLDPNSIREIIKLFGDEDGVLEQLAKDSEAYAEAMKVVESVAESLVGGVVGDLTDKIVDSWWEAGQAALDYADILGDVAKAYAKLIVNDMLLEAAFDPNRQEAFKDALRNGDTGKAMSIVEGAMQSAVDMLPAINSALQVLEPYRNPSGETESGAGSLGSGIKNITEETASLLASYVNAIRADVSYIRSMYESGFEGISAIGTALPTLNDYLAQCAANTYDMAQSNQRILSELQSVIGAPGTSGMVVRVETA